MRGRDMRYVYFAIRAEDLIAACGEGDEATGPRASKDAPGGPAVVV